MTKKLIRMPGYTVILSLIFLMLTSCEKESGLIDPEIPGTWENYTSANGLPGNNIRDIMLDSRGDLWVAFWGAGVSVYDGTSWTTYNTANSDILSNNITCIEEDHDGDMWFGTQNGISFLVDGTTWFYLQDPVEHYYIQDIKRDSQGWVYAGTRDHCFIGYDGNTFYFSELYTTPELNSINSIEEDRNKNLWFGTDLGILIWDNQQWNYLSVLDMFECDVISSLYCDSKNRMWIGTEGGSMVGYSKNNNITGVSVLNGGIPVYVRDIFEDNLGNIWFATWYDGVIRNDGVISESFKEYNGFPENDAEAVAQDKQGNIWIGTYSEGLAKYNLPLNLN